MSAKAPVKDLESTKPLCSYDEVMYVSLPFRHTHPDRMAVMGSILGMTPAPIERCRVLEIGCASGGNLIPMAVALPDSEFLGIDLSERQVAEGQKLIEELGLKNVRIEAMDVTNFSKETGMFDYIVTHGVYSWIPPEAQEKILEICNTNLNPNGIAYISYNTYPGWHFRGAVRDMMLYATQGATEPKERLAKGRGVVDFLSSAVKTFDQAAQGPYAIKPYEMMLSEESGFLKQQREDYLLHEHLSDFNEPLYFWQFLQRAAKHNLQYLSEAEFSTTRPTNFSKEIQDELAKMADVLKVEQYMDFVRNRTFRQTLLCNQEAELNRNFDLLSIRKLFVASPATPETPINLQSREAQTFVYSGSRFTTPNILVKAAFQYLSEMWPRSVSFSELLNVARSRCHAVAIQEPDAAEREAQILASDLLLAYGINLLTLRSKRDPFITEISERPLTTVLVRHQAATNAHVTNLVHETTDLDVLNRHLLSLLDGNRDKEQLVDELAVKVQNNVLVVHQNGQELKEGEELRKLLRYYVDERLPQLARACLLIG